MDIFVSGSLAYDRIMNFEGRFADHILPDKIHILNVCFTVNGMKEKFGGTAGNIVYALALLGEKPTILSSIGHDYERYFSWLHKNNIKTDTIHIVEDEFTASAYITTDLSDNQITGFNPGAMNYSSGHTFDEVNPSESIGIVAPGNLDDMFKYCRIYKEKGMRYIFDPGQSLTAWDAERLRESVNGSTLLISNDYELEIIQKTLGMNREKLLGLTGTIITTKAEHGSVVFSKQGETVIPAIEPERVADPTGAGDAYRGGLIKGLSLGRDIIQSALMGSLCASYAVACHGTQEYRFDPDQFMAAFNSLCASHLRTGHKDL